MKHERFSDKMLDIRQQELRRREELRCKREADFERHKANSKTVFSIFDQCRRPKYVTVDECFGSDTCKWDGSSVSDFETKAKDAVISDRGSSAQRQSGVDC